MSTSSASTWVKFFLNAGIPSPANATYAHIFVKNRIAMDMLTELNKEYLREMGITPMGDIISILRHSKNVTDQTVRDNILTESEPIKMIAKVIPAPVSSSPARTIVKSTSRRVLPEHEGKYKISLPKGSTKKSREILALHSALQSDKMEKKSIFDRLTSKDVAKADSTSSEPLFKVTSSSSIFKRLGSYNELEKKIERDSIAFSGILKSSPTHSPLRGVVKHRVQPRFMPKPVIRDLTPGETSDSSMESETDDRMEMDELKQVSFSPDVEVRMFKQLPTRNANSKPLQGLKHDGIKARLGRTEQISPPKKNFHVVKTVSMKPVRASQSVASRVSKMKSDSMAAQTTIHSRLDIKNRTRDKVTKMDTRVEKPKGSSVFNRLGRNN